LYSCLFIYTQLSHLKNRTTNCTFKAQIQTKLNYFIFKSFQKEITGKKMQKKLGKFRTKVVVSNWWTKLKIQGTGSSDDISFAGIKI